METQNPKVEASAQVSVNRVADVDFDEGGWRVPMV
jgi:hypothetical protein